eukprot:2921340-Karenia_brevis.AAC.1
MPAAAPAVRLSLLPASSLGQCYAVWMRHRSSGATQLELPHLIVGVFHRVEYHKERSGHLTRRVPNQPRLP